MPFGVITSTATVPIVTVGDPIASSVLQQLSFPNTDMSGGGISLTSQQLLSVIDSQGNFDVEIQFTATADYFTNYNSGGTMEFFHGVTPDGLLACQRTQSVPASVQFQGNFLVRGVDQTNPLVFGSDSCQQQWKNGDVVLFRATYNRSIGLARYTTVINGASVDAVLLPTNTASGNPLSPPTSFVIGGSGGIVGTLQRVTFFSTSPVAPSYGPVTALEIGDSTVASYRFVPAIASDLRSPSVSYSTYIDLIAVAGDTIALQRSRLQNSAYSVAPLSGAIKVVRYEIGINDVKANRTEPQISADITSLIALGRQLFPNAKHVLSKLIPFGSGYVGGQQAVATAVNNDIAGTGANPITNADAVIGNYYTTLGGGTDFLVSPYIGLDGIHESTPARQVIANEYAAKLLSLGITI